MISFEKVKNGQVMIKNGYKFYKINQWKMEMMVMDRLAMVPAFEQRNVNFHGQMLEVADGLWESHLDAFYNGSAFVFR